MVADRPDSVDPSTERITEVLAQRIFQHLQDEESSLVGVLEAVRSLHHSLRFMNAEEMSRSLQSEAAALGTAQHVQSSRYEFRTEMGNVFGIPPERMTLTVLAGKTSGSLHDGILESRRRLEEMSTELNILNRQNAAMLQQSLCLIRGIIGRLTRSAGFGEAYNAGGARQESHVGSLLEWGG